MELITRLVYIDTSAYERKHFQFGLYILEKLENFASHDKVRILVTDITRREIELHIRKNAEEALKELNKFGYTDLMVDGAPSPHQSDTTLRWLID
ncbi:PIN domain-containing protein, partial [Raoultella planticola]|uniref:PIN domain-containing protein n=1 Tax=Raoultella planticola TaxID=575 RepID=UPI002FFD21D3